MGAVKFLRSLDELREALIVARSVMSKELSPSACAIVDAALSRSAAGQSLTSKSEDGSSQQENIS